MLSLHVAIIGTNLIESKKILEQEKLIAIPTETVYGLAANALNENAVLKIFETKQRPFFDPLIVHISSINEVEKYAHWSNEKLKILAQTFWPGPLTILLPKKNSVPEIVVSGLEQVGLRVPNHTVTLELLKQLNFPLAAPSANPFGYISPTNAQHVNKQLGNKIDYILDGGECEVGLESTIVGFEEDKICVYRLGGLSIEAIENCIGKVELKINVSSNPKAPGQLKSHYAPRKPLLIGDLEDLIKNNSSKKITVISFGEKIYKAQNIKNLYLSVSGNLNEAAINLFKFLRLADDDESELILAEFVPNEGLGLAINDRLRRACSVY